MSSLRPGRCVAFKIICVFWDVHHHHLELIYVKLFGIHMHRNGVVWMFFVRIAFQSRSLHFVSSMYHKNGQDGILHVWCYKYWMFFDPSSLLWRIFVCWCTHSNYRCHRDKFLVVLPRILKVSKPTSSFYIPSPYGERGGSEKTAARVDSLRSMSQFFLMTFGIL